MIKFYVEYRIALEVLFWVAIAILCGATCL